MAYFRIFSWNVLSSALGTPKHHYTDPQYLNSTNRLEKVRAILEEKMEQGYILCLQEVSRDWMGHLLPLFQEYGYFVIDSLYSNYFDGYMGILTALPSEIKLKEVRMERLADSLNCKKIKKEQSSGWRSWSDWLHLTSPQKKVPSFDAMARLRNNVTLMLRLAYEDEEFCLVNLHLPSTFKWPQVSTLHCEALIRRSTEFAQGLPLCLVGDFNFTPDSPLYNYFLGENIYYREECFPYPGWKPFSGHRFDSVFVQFFLSEPAYTLASSTKNGDFVSVLDYAFLTPHWIVKHVEPLPDEEPSTEEEFLPNAQHPSDHLPLEFEIAIKSVEEKEPSSESQNSRGDQEVQYFLKNKKIQGYQISDLKAFLQEVAAQIWQIPIRPVPDCLLRKDGDNFLYRGDNFTWRFAAAEYPGNKMKLLSVKFHTAAEPWKIPNVSRFNIEDWLRLAPNIELDPEQELILQA